MDNSPRCKETLETTTKLIMQLYQDIYTTYKLDLTRTKGRVGVEYEDRRKTFYPVP